MDNEFAEELTKAVAKVKDVEEALRFAIEALEQLQTKLDRERDWLLNTAEDDKERPAIIKHAVERLESIEMTLANKHLYLRSALDDIETRLDKV